MNKVRQYVGARYVPKFSDPIDWKSGTSYEALTVVNYNNSSYTSKKPVPGTVGNPAQNPEYWVLTGNYNAQVEEYRQETEEFKNTINTKTQRISTPEYYGAKGDGSTDDYNAIQTCINENDIVILDGRKTYALGTAIYASHSGLQIIGNGAKIKKTTGHTTCFYIGTDDSSIHNIEVNNVEFIGNSNIENEFPIIRVTVTQAERYIYNVIIKNCYIHETNGYGIGLYNNGSTPSQLQVSILNNYLYNINGVGIAQSKVSTIIKNNIISKTGAECITLDNLSVNSVISANSLSDFKISAIGMDGAGNCVISDNCITNTGESTIPGIVLSNNQGVCDHCSIAGNVIKGTTRGVYIGYCTNTSITNNPQSGVYISKAFTENCNAKIFDSGYLDVSNISQSIILKTIVTDCVIPITLTPSDNITWTGRAYFENGIIYIYGDVNYKNSSSDGVKNLLNCPWTLNEDKVYDNIVSEDDTLRLGGITFTGSEVKAFLKTANEIYVPINVALVLS